MALLTWSELYTFGISKIDSQHKRLIELINTLHEASESGKEKQELSYIIDELIEYTIYHFAEEEKLMWSSRFPDFISHKNEHHEFSHNIIAFRMKFESGQRSVATELLDFLMNWLTNHLLIVDKQYVSHFIEKGVF